MYFNQIVLGIFFCIHFISHILHLVIPDIEDFKSIVSTLENQQRILSEHNRLENTLSVNVSKWIIRY